MKFAPRTLSLLVLALISTFYVSCNKDEGKKETEEEKQFKKLKGVWNIVSANDGTDRTSEFTGFTLTMDGNYVEGGTYNYSVTGERPERSPWPANGTWKFDPTNKLTQIIRDPGGQSEILMSYQVTDAELVLSFTIPDGSEGWPGGRISSVAGDWTFTFSR